MSPIEARLGPDLGLGLRSPEPGEAERLSAIARQAKAHWGYPAEWLELWRSSLTFDAELLARDWVRVADQDGVAVAVVVVAGEPPIVEVTHLWVVPSAMGRGFGRRLFAAAVEHARGRGAQRLKVVSDPNAETFYRRLGATLVGEVPSEPEGRLLPHLELAL